ncbi:hypothetical protein C1D09_018815 [Mesorhizobium intechi]|uniref:Uncharacterized protein n=1 Tax=Mesorhizobium intechi TaxID=537601 RepID=A0A8T9AR97_9HYPH|nr:hypothetical protein [Mesorhizobium intechi]TSE07585.1 hypothetical protein C1D09_018815 [Mesorhizobium intechi]
MAMTKTLYSISALAIELDRDRRTIAQALKAVPPDGKLAGGKHDGWYLSTATKAFLSDRSSPTTGGDRPRKGSALDHYVDRLVDWQELAEREPQDFPIDEAVEVFGIPRDALVTWLRCGMPYAVAGDFKTGDGFVLRSKWLFDWQIALTVIAASAGWPAAARTLKIPEI